MKKIYSIVVIMILLGVQTWAQDGFMLRNLTNAPQSLRENPGIMPLYGFHVGFPGISSINVNANSPVSFSEAIHITNSFPDNFNSRSRVAFGFLYEPLTVGFKLGKNYFSLSGSARTDGQWNIHQDMVTLLVEGNGNSLGQKLNLLDKKAFNINSYGEMALGFTRAETDKLSYGVRLKYLVGFANIKTNNAELSWYTNEDYTSTTLGYNCNINMSSPVIKVSTDTAGKLQFDDSDFTYPKSRGWGLDLGVNYKVNDKIDVNFAVLDLGFITWKDNASQISMPEGGQYTFDGFTSEQLWNADGTFNKKFYEAIADTLKNVMEFNTRNVANYTSNLKSRFIAGGSYEIIKGGKAGVAYQGDFGNGRMYSTFNVSYTQRLGQWFQATVGNTFQNKSYFNPGIGFCAGIGPFQIYTAINKVSSFYVDKMKNASVVFGINFVGGFDKKDKKKASEPQGTPPSKLTE